MERFLKWFNIEIDETRHVVMALLQRNESIVFTITMNGQQLRLYKDENDQWAGNGDPGLIRIIGMAIELTDKY